MPTTDVLKTAPQPLDMPQPRQVQFTPKSTLPEIASQLARHPYTGAAPKNEHEYYLNSLTNNITSNGPLNDPGNRHAVALGTKPMAALTSRFVEYLKNNKQRANAVRETHTGPDGLPQGLPSGMGLSSKPAMPTPSKETKDAAKAAVSKPTEMSKKASGSGLTKFFKPAMQKKAEDTSDLTEEELAEYQRRSHSRWKSFFKGAGLGALIGGGVGGVYSGVTASDLLNNPNKRIELARTIQASSNGFRPPDDLTLSDLGRANDLATDTAAKATLVGGAAGLGAAGGTLLGGGVGGIAGAILSGAPAKNEALLAEIRARRNKRA